MHQKRKYSGKTRPAQCTRMIPSEGSSRIPTQCKERVHRAGQCFAHWKESRINRTMKALNAPVVVERCCEYKCFKTAVINQDGKLYCMRHFNNMARKYLALEALLNESSNGHGGVEGISEGGVETRGV